MRFRRGIVSYILWALYGLAVCAALTLQIRTTGLFFLREETLWYLPAAAGCACGIWLVSLPSLRLILMQKTPYNSYTICFTPWFGSACAAYSSIRK